MMTHNYLMPSATKATSNVISISACNIPVRLVTTTAVATANELARKSIIYE